MAIRSRGPSAGLGWLTSGFEAAFDNPKPMFAGAALVALALILTLLITLPVELLLLQLGIAPTSSAFKLVTILPTLIGLVLFPLYAGYLQIIDAVEHGEDARVRDIFKLYRQNDALKVIGFGLVLTLLYSALYAIIGIVTAGGFVNWYMQGLTVRTHYQLPPAALPYSFWVTLLVAIAISVFMMGVHAIGIGQITFRQRSVLGAISDGILGALKNLLPLLSFALSLFLAGIPVIIAFSIFFFVLNLLGKLVGAWLVFVIIVPVYTALALVTVAVMFGVMYHLWLEVCGNDIATELPQPDAV